MYDSFHRRLSKTCNGIETKYFYHNQNEIGASSEGNIFQLRVLGLSYGAEIGAAVAFELDGNTYAPINDPLGNVVALLDLDGNLVESYRYTAFGEMEVGSDYSVDNPWMYSSKRLDVETGFIYFGRRYYVPDLKEITRSLIQITVWPFITYYYAYKKGGTKWLTLNLITIPFELVALITLLGMDPSMENRVNLLIGLPLLTWFWITSFKLRQLNQFTLKQNKACNA